jgi:uncharacterized protein (DUF427 family)
MTKRDRETLPSWARMGREGWSYRGQKRPPFAIAPGPGQESVWDYPRPPRIEVDRRRIEVRCQDALIASTTRAVRVLETAHPPTFYIPREDVRMALLERSSDASHCEWKGAATYYDVRVGDERIAAVAWSYEQPFADAERLRGHLSFYPGRIACTVDGERVQPQPGGFYGGWVTSDVVGPFKGEPGTGDW